MNLPKIIRSAILIFFLFVLSYSTSFAASGIISIEPSTSNQTVDQTFKADVKVNGGGTEFNAAQATVSLSQNLNIQDVTLGDCNFAFVKMPTSSNPSFAGVILGGSSNLCTVFSLTLKTVSPGTGYVTLSDASIKEYKSAAEILSVVKNGSYTISGDSSTSKSTSVTAFEMTPTLEPAVSDGLRLYDVVYKVILPASIKPSSVTVTLDPQLHTRITPEYIPNQDVPKTVYVRFSNVTQGVHTVNAYSDGKIISSQIMNVSGNDREFAFGTTAKQSQSSILVFSGIIFVIIAIALGYWFLTRKMQPPSPIPQP